MWWDCWTLTGALMAGVAEKWRYHSCLWIERAVWGEERQNPTRQRIGAGREKMASKKEWLEKFVLMADGSSSVNLVVV